MASDRQAVWGGEPKPLMPYSPAIKAGGWVFFAGQLASDFKDGLAPEAGGDGRNPNVENRLELQSRFVMQNLKKTAEAAGLDIGKDIVRIYQWFTSPYPTMDEFAEGNSVVDARSFNSATHASTASESASMVTAPRSSTYSMQSTIQSRCCSEVSTMFASGPGLPGPLTRNMFGNPFTPSPR